MTLTDHKLTRGISRLAPYQARRSRQYAFVIKISLILIVIIIFHISASDEFKPENITVNCPTSWVRDHFSKLWIFIWLLAILKSNPTLNFADIILFVRAKGNALRDKHKNKDWSIFYFSWTNKRFQNTVKIRIM